MPDRIFNALPDIYDAALDGHRWQNALDSLTAVLKARGAVLIAYDLAESPFHIQEWSSLYSADDLREYGEKFQKYELEIAEFLRTVPPRFVGRDTDIWENLDHESHRPDLVYLKQKFGILQRAGAQLNTHQAWRDMITLQLGVSWDNVPPVFWRTLEMAIPHLSKAVEIGRTFSILRMRYQAALAALDHVGVGMCIGTPSARIAVSNQEAQRIFSAGDGLRLWDDDRLAAEDEDTTRKLQHAIELTAQTAAGQGICDEFTIPCSRRSSATPLLVEICPLRDSGNELERHFYGSLICIIDPDHTADISTVGLARIFGFSQAETEVCDALIKGMTNNNIAEERNVSTETIRTQVRSIYTKAGVGSRHELIRLALTVNPPIR